MAEVHRNGRVFEDKGKICIESTEITEIDDLKEANDILGRLEHEVIAAGDAIKTHRERQERARKQRDQLVDILGPNRKQEGGE